eukprot:7383942-Prymnesium_polylepis.1
MPRECWLPSSDCADDPEGRAKHAVHACGNGAHKRGVARHVVAGSSQAHGARRAAPRRVRQKAQGAREGEHAEAVAGIYRRGTHEQSSRACAWRW